MVQVNNKASSRMVKGTKLHIDLTPGKKLIKCEEAAQKVNDPICVRTFFGNEDQLLTEFSSPGSSSGYSEATLLPDVPTNDGSEAMLITGTNSESGRSFSLRIPERIVNFLEFDCYMVTMKNKQHRLPQKLSVARILQDYLVWYVGNYAFKKKPDTYTLNTGEVFEVFDPLTSIRFVFSRFSRKIISTDFNLFDINQVVPFETDFLHECKLSLLQCKTISP